MAWASSRLIASPSPMPSAERVSPRSTCTNGSKIASSLSAAPPAPVSATRMRTSASSGSAEIATVPSSVGCFVVSGVCCSLDKIF